MEKPYRGTIADAQVVQISGKLIVYGLLYGSTLGHPDGCDIRTSWIVSINGDQYETRNSIYTVKLA